MGLQDQMRRACQRKKAALESLNRAESPEEVTKARAEVLDASRAVMRVQGDIDKAQAEAERKSWGNKQ
jgi:hypothetical protein